MPDKIVHTLAQILLAVSAVVLTIMMSLTAADVVMRYVYGLPIPGSDELTEYMMAFIVPFAIAYCAEQRGHVSVELLFKKFPKLFQDIVGILVSTLTLWFAAAMTWQNILYIVTEYGKEKKVTSAVLEITTYPFYAPIALGIGVYTLVITFQLIKTIGEVKAR